MAKKSKYNATLLTIYFIASLMLPIFILTYTEHNPLWISLSGILLPLGVYTLFASLSRYSGRVVWLCFVFIFISAFQVVLSYLFGNSVIAADMFLNLETTNSSEAGELLNNIYPAVIFVILVYVPLLWIALVHISKDVVLKTSTRRNFAIVGGVAFAIGCVTLIFGCRGNEREVLRDKVFPINVGYNLYLAMAEYHKINNYKKSSEEFLYHAKHDTRVDMREVYVLVIGEASRAASWQLYGYNRATNPLLSQRDDITIFSQITTQSNTTHKSVPMILSSIHTSQHDELYKRTGLMALFNEAGFTTYFISTQQRQSAMIDHLASDANFVVYEQAPYHDGQMIETMQNALNESRSQKILFVLHTYGSHYSYHQRYPCEFAHFLPDDDVAISKKNIEMIRNAYDNSIRYTDYLLSEIISLLEKQPNTCSAMFYCADHGEDLLDTEAERFLHASPTATYYQLHIASVMWFSTLYRELFADKVEAAYANENSPATTYSVFHTMADLASIYSPYINIRASLLSNDFDFAAKRYYLNDHNQAVPLDKNIGIDEVQYNLLRQAGVEIK